MFDKVIAFGDSFVSGDELSQELIPDLIDQVKQFWGTSSSISNLGDLETTRTDITYTKHKEWRSGILEKFYFGAAIAKTKSYSGLVATHYNAEYHNYAYPGYSMTGIYSSIIKNLDVITENSLVIVGLTFSDRITRFKPYYVECEPGRNFSKDKNHGRYIELDVEYGNDIITKLLWTQSIIESIKNVIKCKRLIFVDPVNIYRENNDLENFNYFTTQRIIENYIAMNTVDDEKVDTIVDTHTDIIEYLTNYYNDEIFPFTFAHSINTLLKENKKVKCILGHPSYAVHKDFTEKYLIPAL